MSYLKFLTIIFISVLFISCAKKESNFILVKPVIEAESVVYLYRPDSMSNIMISPDVLINGDKKLEIKNKSYSYIPMSPGKHLIELKLAERYSGIQKLSLNLEQGEIVYLRVGTSLKFEMNKPYSRSFSLEMVESESALTEIEKTKFIEINKSDESENSNLLNDVSNSSGSDVSKDEFSIDKTRNPFGK